MNEKNLEQQITERQFRQQVLDLAQILGWRAYFTWASVHSPAGFPDLVLVRLSRLLMVELKSEKGKLTETQKEWLESLEATGKVEVYVWKPCDWDALVEILR